tara:strand:- start:244 stop:546 length:303 start_codon:yes stop_codon:yes gene_type:complete
MKKSIIKLEIDIFFNRNATSPLIPNKIAQIKDYLSINSPIYYNSVKFVGGYKIEEQNQSVANFVIFTDNQEEIKKQFITIFKSYPLYISFDNKIPELIKN